MQLRPLPVLRRDPTTIQVGTDPRWAVALTDLTPAAVTALATVEPGTAEHTVRARLRAERVPGPEADAIVAHLVAARLLVPATGVAAVEVQPDARALGLLEADGNARRALDGRARRRVRVEGLDRLGATVVQALATAGLGELELVDPAPVSAQEVGFGGFTGRDVGRPRPFALARAVQTDRPALRTTALASPRPDLVVLVERGAADPARHRVLRDADVAHLSVVAREASVLVGPLVVPGRTACLTCVDLWRAEADPAWPLLAAQLTGRSGAGSEASLAAVGGALAAAQALAHLDGRGCLLHDGAFEVALPGAVPRAQQWLPHPACGCGSHVRP